jgi:hypothetical protein
VTEVRRRKWFGRAVLPIKNASFGARSGIARYYLEEERSSNALTTTDG